MKCLVAIAHPDDEAIWTGGTILRHPDWEWHILSLCRRGDPDREPRFWRAASELGAEAFISDLDDSPALSPLSPDLSEIKNRVRELSALEHDLIFTHGEKGEYTRHERHEQVHRAIRELVESGELSGRLLFFAYDDCDGTCAPRPNDNAQVFVRLLENEYTGKRRIVRDIYGFGPGSFEYNAAGPVEAFKVHGEADRLDSLLRFGG